MATHFPPGPWIRTIMYFQNGEKQYQNDIWFKAGTFPGGVDINAVAAAVDTALQAPFAGLMNENALVIGNTTYANNGVYTVSAETQTTLPGVGTAKILPSEDAVIVRINAAIATRAGNGRIFVGGIDTSFIDESKLSASGAVAATALCTALKGVVDLGGIGCNLAVWSRKLGVLEPAVFCDPATVLGHRRKRRPVH
jgi:hypothetical protein